MIRPDWDEYFLDIAEKVALRGSCPRLQVGAVLVDNDNGIIATGYNGSPRGLPDCTEIGCYTPVGERCERTLHAESNTLLQAGRNGASTVGTTIYVTYRPCYRCCLQIVQAGISRVVYRFDYSSDSAFKVDEMLALANISFRKEPHEVRTISNETSRDHTGRFD